MKKIMLGFFLSIFGFNNSEAQSSNYLPFPISNAGWEIDFWIGPGYPHEYHYYYMNKQNNDTTINSDLYGKLYVSYSGFISDTIYIGALREKIPGQVSYFPKDSLNEFLLYDFNLNVNDTFNNFYTDGPPFGAGVWSGKILSRDSIFIANRYQRILEVECLTFNGKAWGGHDFWREGVGGDGGLLENIRMASVSGNTTLTCMNHQDTLWHSYFPPGTPGNCTFFYQQVSEMSNEPFAIYPNPSTGTFIIRLNSQLTNTEAIIYDMLGKEMMRKSFSGDKMEIEKGNMESGVYFVKVRAGEKEFVQKLIVE